MSSIWFALTILHVAPHVLGPRPPIIPVTRDACDAIRLTPWDTLKERAESCRALRGSLP